MEERKRIALREILDYAKAHSGMQDNKLEGLCLYTSPEVMEHADLSLHDLFYLDDVPNFDINDEEVFPTFVTENGLELMCDGFRISDVVSYALQQKPDAAREDLLESLDFYLQTDGFLEFSKRNQKYISFIIIPGFTVTEFLSCVERFGTKRLRKYQYIEAGQGIAFYTYDKKSQTDPLADFISTQYSPALVVNLSDAFWTHRLYLNGYCSPKELPLAGQEGKKRPKTGLMANTKALMTVFSHTKEICLESYLYQERFRALEKNPKAIKNFYIMEGMAQKLYQKNGELFVRDHDRFPVGDYRQAFDFMKYLGYNLPVTLFP